jgi:hypothetical protein
MIAAVRLFVLCYFTNTASDTPNLKENNFAALHILQNTDMKTFANSTVNMNR